MPSQSDVRLDVQAKIRIQIVKRGRIEITGRQPSVPLGDVNVSHPAELVQHVFNGTISGRHLAQDLSQMCTSAPLVDVVQVGKDRQRKDETRAW